MNTYKEHMEIKKAPLTMNQMMFILLNGFGHLTSMAGFVFVAASIMYMAVGSVNSWVGLVVGFLTIVLGYQLQQLGEKLELRHTAISQHLDLDIKQHLTTAIALTVVIATIFTI